MLSFYGDGSAAGHAKHQPRYVLVGGAPNIGALSAGDVGFAGCDGSAARFVRELSGLSHGGPAGRILTVNAPFHSFSFDPRHFQPGNER
jgi:hypothetical protein